MHLHTESMWLGLTATASILCWQRTSLVCSQDSVKRGGEIHDHTFTQPKVPYAPTLHFAADDLICRENIFTHQNQDDAIEKKLTDFKEQMFVAGSDVTLWCGNNVTDVKWNELIYILWNISRQGRKCYLGLSHTLRDNTCNDGKKLYNTSNGVSLFIPNISVKDEGFYSCDLSIKGRSKALNVSVSVIRLETRLDIENSQRIAVCEATYKNMAPTLHWEPDLNFSFKNTSVKNVDAFSIIENRVHLPDNVTISILSCVASYPSESGSLQQKIPLYIPTQVPGERTFPWVIAVLSSGSVCLILVPLAVVYLLRRKLKHISSLKLCCKSKISPPAEDKPPQPDVEEVEPYASYVQRVNSIYNSSAELCNA